MFEVTGGLNHGFSGLAGRLKVTTIARLCEERFVVVLEERAGRSVFARGQ
jgi:hypothetical protein